MKDTPAPKKSSPADKKAKMPRKITQDYLENAGKFYLEKFPASVKHFKTVMIRKIRKSCQAYPEQSYETCMAHLDKVVEKFISYGFLDDKAFTKGLLHSYQQRGWSQRKIRATMAQKGLPSPMIEEELEDVPSSSDLVSALRWVKRKRLGSYATGENKTEKWLASLGRAGFDYETARKALALPRHEIEELLRDLS